MSRVGKKPIVIPDKVKATFEGRKLTVKGPKGELYINVPEEIDYKIEDKTLTFSRSSDLKHIRALHGLTRALAFNVFEGVTNGFQKDLQIEGVGYKAEMKGKNLMLSLGFSHPILIIPPNGIEISATSPTALQIKGIDKQMVGQVAAKIRSIRPPEPYKGKGVRYVGEYIRRKAGKTTSK